MKRGKRGLLRLAGVLIVVASVGAASTADAQAAGEVSGLVTAAGRPVAGYCVSIVRIPKADFHVHAITNGDGRFDRSGLPPGIYEISNDVPGTCPADARSRYLIAASAETSVDLRHGGSQTATLRVKLGGALTGTVTDAATGLPAHGNVCIEEKPSHHIPWNFPIVNGRFLATQLFPEPTRLAVVAGCHGAVHEAYPYATSFWPTGGLKVAEAQTFKISPGKTTSLSGMAVQRTGAIAGQVVRVGSHAPIPHLCVEANDTFGSTRPFGGLSTTPSGKVGFFTDSTGAYAIHSVPPGRYQLRLSSDVNESAKPTEGWSNCFGPFLEPSTPGSGVVPTEVVVNSSAVTTEVNFEAPTAWASK